MEEGGRGWLACGGWLATRHAGLDFRWKDPRPPTHGHARECTHSIPPTHPPTHPATHPPSHPASQPASQPVTHLPTYPPTHPSCVFTGGHPRRNPAPQPRHRQDLQLQRSGQLVRAGGACGGGCLRRLRRPLWRCQGVQAAGLALPLSPLWCAWPTRLCLPTGLPYPKPPPTQRGYQYRVGFVDGDAREVRCCWLLLLLLLLLQCQLAVLLQVCLNAFACTHAACASAAPLTCVSCSCCHLSPSPLRLLRPRCM